MRRRLAPLVVLLAITAASCDDDSGGPFGGDSPLAPASSDEIAAAVEAFQPGANTDHASRSALDGISAERRSALDASAMTLVGLLPSPDDIGAFRLGNLQADDPNGDGRIGAYWYPPRVLRQECSAKVDAAPGPYAAAVYVPGSGPLAETDPTDAFDLMSAAITVTIQVQLFDDASQRDAYLDATVEFYRDPSFMCGGKKASMQTYRESELQTDRIAASVFEASDGPLDAVLGGGVRTKAAVGERMLLSVSMANDAVDAPWDTDELTRWVGPVLDVAVARLEAVALP